MQPLFKRIKPKGGRKPGSQNFNNTDLEQLVTLLEQVLGEQLEPLGGEQWDQVVLRYNAEHAVPAGRNTRDRDGLRQAWYKMVSNPLPTRDPACPEHVRRAKRLYRAMHTGLAMAMIMDDDEEIPEGERGVEGEREREGEKAEQAERQAEREAAEAAEAEESRSGGNTGGGEQATGNEDAEEQSASFTPIRPSGNFIPIRPAPQPQRPVITSAAPPSARPQIIPTSATPPQQQIPTSVAPPPTTPFIPPRPPSTPSLSSASRQTPRTHKTSIDTPLSLPSVPRATPRSHATSMDRRNSVAQEDEQMQLMMRSFDPAEQAAREERLATQRFLQMQVLYLQKKLSEREDEVRELHKENDELQRHITRLEMQQFRAEMAAQYGGRDNTLKRKAPGSDDENAQPEGADSL